MICDDPDYKHSCWKSLQNVGNTVTANNDILLDNTE